MSREFVDKPRETGLPLPLLREIQPTSAILAVLLLTVFWITPVRMKSQSNSTHARKAEAGGATFELMGFAGGEKQSDSLTRAESFGFDMVECENWRKWPSLQTVCFRRNVVKEEVLTLAFGYGILVRVVYVFPVAQFEEVRLDFNRRFGSPVELTTGPDGLVAESSWRDIQRNVVINIDRVNSDASLDATSLIESLKNRCNPITPLQSSLHIDSFIMGESVCDSMRKAGIPIGKLPDLEENKFGLTPPSTSDAEEMVEKLFKGSNEAYNLVFSAGPPNGALSQVWVFTKTPYSVERARLVAKYGAPAQETSTLHFGEIYREATWVLRDSTTINLVEDGVQNAQYGFMKFTRILYLDRD
jgi:hypothetical protein